MSYDYLIVGAGLFGATFARKISENGKSCLVIDKRHHVAGNVYTEYLNNIHVHKYGAHIFHTSDKTIWEYANCFAEFNNFINSPIARYRDEVYNMPFNMNTFYKLWNVKTPDDAKIIIERQRAETGISVPQNLEEQALWLVGRDIYEKLIKGYTEKQWGCNCKDLPAFIISRIPLRFTYDNNYFSERYQGIPVDGYTAMVLKMLDGVDVQLGTEYSKFIIKNQNIAKKTVYTGSIDEFFNYCFGELEYRSLRFETEILNTDNYQGNAVVNYTEHEVPYTRIVEHKHFNFFSGPGTIITREYPVVWFYGLEPYYPINSERNNKLYGKYRILAEKREDLLFGGRLGQYKYYDMDKVIGAALDAVAREI